MKLKNLIPKKLIEGNGNYKNRFGCVMLYFWFPDMKEIHSMIDKNDIFVDPDDNSFGLETEPHTTLLYGLHNGVQPSSIREIVGKYDYFNYELSNPSVFVNKDFDVLKFDIIGDNLHEVNTDLSQLPHTTQYPDYIPHMTIGYLKSGTGKKYVDMIKNSTKAEYEIEPNYIVYSEPTGKKTKININIDRP